MFCIFIFALPGMCTHFVCTLFARMIVCYLSVQHDTVSCSFGIDHNFCVVNVYLFASLFLCVKYEVEQGRVLWRAHTFLVLMQALAPPLWRLNLVIRTVNIVRDSTLHHQYHHSCHRHRLKHHQISSSSSPASLSTASFQSTIYNSLNLRRSSQTKIIHIVMAFE